MPSTKRRSPREELVADLKRHDVRQPKVVVEEAKRADIKVATALALMEQETGIPQRNIFGHDYGGPFPGQKVTKDRVKALRQSGKQNGVGWTQLTYGPYVDEAEKMGGAHIPRYQMRVGFKHLRKAYDASGDSLQKALAVYNGGPSNPNYTYAHQVLQKRSRWMRVTEGK
jgi:hypothetical protein